jgi:uncharacterized small protein (DUF1192 family)
MNATKTTNTTKPTNALSVPTTTKQNVLEIENRIRMLHTELDTLKANPGNKQIFDELDKEKHERKQLFWFGDKNSDLDGDVFEEW